MPVGFDKMSFNRDLRMYLPFREGVGAITHDYAKPHREVDLVNAPAWTTIASGLPVMAFDGVNQYLECDTLDTVDLDYTSEDYSIIGWVNWTDTGSSEIIIARYEVDDTPPVTFGTGWETYFYNNAGVMYLSQRHHHWGGATDRTSAYSSGWTPGTPWLLGISRSGGYPIHYRNGVPLTTTCNGGLLDPLTCARDLVIGTRFTKDSNWFSGWIGNLGVIGVALSARDHMNIFQLNKHWFN